MPWDGCCKKTPLCKWKVAVGEGDAADVGTCACNNAACCTCTRKENALFVPQVLRSHAGRKEDFEAVDILHVWRFCWAELTLNKGTNLKAVTTKLNPDARFTQMYFPFAQSRCTVHVTRGNSRSRLWTTVSQLLKKICRCIIKLLMIILY